MQRQIAWSSVFGSYLLPGNVAQVLWHALQVVQVCAEHKKPAKLLKHLTQIKVCACVIADKQGLHCASVTAVICHAQTISDNLRNLQCTFHRHSQMLFRLEELFMLKQTGCCCTFGRTD